MEQTELHSAQLIDVKVSIYPIFFKQENVTENEQFTKKKLREKDMPQDYLRCPSSQFLSIKIL